MVTEEYVHDYKLVPGFKTQRDLRKLHHDHSFAMNTARDYENEFSRMDYESQDGISRVRFMLRRNIFEYRNKSTINVVERIGLRLKALPSQDDNVKKMTQRMRELYKLLNVAGKYYGTSGKERADNKIIFYETLAQFKTKRNE